MTRNVTSAMARIVGMSHSSRDRTYWTNQASGRRRPRGGPRESAYYLASGGGSQGVNGWLTPGQSSPQTRWAGSLDSAEGERRVGMNAEERRLKEAQERSAHWRRWGPYLSERQWGTVREDYSPFGTAWEYFPHDHARSRAYR